MQVIDDPVRENPPDREKILAWYHGAAGSRKVVAARMHTDDLVSQMLVGDWPHLVIKDGD